MKKIVFIILAFFLASCGGGGGGGVPSVTDISVTDEVLPVNDLTVFFGDADVDFNATISKNVTIKNTGTADLVLGDLSAVLPLSPFSLDEACSGTTLQPNDTCVVSVSFTPTMAGTFEDSFDIPSNDPDSGTVTVDLIGGGADYYHLFILSGQSNMARMDINYFLPGILSRLGSDHVIAVKDALGDQSITQWYDKYDIEGDGEVVGPLYDQLMGKVSTAIANKIIVSVTFVWMQGEKDASLGGLYVEDYEENLLGLIELIESDLATNINFVIGRLNRYGIDDVVLPGWVPIRAIQVSVAESDTNGAWVDTDQMETDPADPIHFTFGPTGGYQALATQFAIESLSLLDNDGFLILNRPY